MKMLQHEIHSDVQPANLVSAALNANYPRREGTLSKEFERSEFVSPVSMEIHLFSKSFTARAAIGMARLYAQLLGNR